MSTPGGDLPRFPANGPSLHGFLDTLRTGQGWRNGSPPRARYSAAREAPVKRIASPRVFGASAAVRSPRFRAYQSAATGLGQRGGIWGDQWSKAEGGAGRESTAYVGQAPLDAGGQREAHGSSSDPP